MINLIEYGQEGLIEKQYLDDEDRMHLSRLQYEDIKKGECRYYLREDYNGIYIKPLNYIGTIQLSKERINIYPRFDHDFSRLIQLILFTKDVKYKSFKQNLSINKSKEDLYEIIISLLLEEVFNIIKGGIFREYVSFNENLKVIRGRIDFKNQLTKNFLRGDSIFCNYEELNTNVLENQIIHKALNIAAKITTDNNNRKKIKNYASLFKEICEEYRGEKVPEISYNRLNSEYKEVHYYSKLLIESIGIGDLYKAGEHNSRYSLLIDMNELFEGFVAALTAKYLVSSYEVKPQFEVGNAILNYKNGTYRKIKPDIILRSKNDEEVIVIDTKNKAYGYHHVYNEDIYQLTFYGLYFYNMFKSKANIFIIYPQYENNDDIFQKIFINTLECNIVKPCINVRAININDYLNLINEGIKSRDIIKDKLLNLFNQNI
ncbi:McrC family protein [Candidatus Clostridium stratigraminis]|uniref:McrC family protein n=1 Tax=Candidatus Clostridium stratigraminis TaxID=3381661 RepID=A0ABW8T6I4_9CLOT